MEEIPILWQHNMTRVVGTLKGNVATFLPWTVTTETMLHAGYRVLEAEHRDGLVYIVRAEILEFSVG